MVLATPLQMAVVAAAWANGGIVLKPRLIDRIAKADGTGHDDTSRWPAQDQREPRAHTAKIDLKPRAAGKELARQRRSRRHC